MSNLDLRFAREYHESTKHSWESLRTDPHFLDWANQPRLFKVYRNVESCALPEVRKSSNRAALSVIAECGESLEKQDAVSLQDLADILYYSAGITRRRAYHGGEVLFRAAACTGALYSIELYVVCREVQGIQAGVYHFSPIDSTLKLLRRGDFGGIIARATAGAGSAAHAPAVVVCSGTYWRNAWKYRARTYRHFGWDNGTILANLLAVTRAKGLPALVISGFMDEEINSLLGLETDREVALNLVPLGYSESASPAYAGDPPALRLEAMSYSPTEVDYPSMRAIHSASSLRTVQEVGAWRSPANIRQMPEPSGRCVSLEPIAENEISTDSIEQVILRRGSSRRFSRSAISFRQLSTILDRATRGVPADFINPTGSQWNDLYLIVHAVSELEPGAYVLQRDPLRLELLKRGEFRSVAGRLGLEQDLPADCSAAVFFLADLNRILGTHGNRGYRATQLEAGIIGGRLYLAAYAQRLGATGLTFYDDEVTEFFSPHASGKSAIFLVALGHSEKPRVLR